VIRKATIDDIKKIYDLLRIYGDRGELLVRPLTELYDHLRDFWVFDQGAADGGVVGCCALQFCWEDLAEIRSLAVDPGCTGRRIGTQLVHRALGEAEEYGINRVFTLTYRPSFFRQFGFYEIDRGELPLKIWGGCLNCVKFPDCDETAMEKRLHPGPDRSRGLMTLRSK